MPSPADLLPLVYDELRRVAAAKLARESPGQTLDVYPHFTVAQGQVKKLIADFSSTVLGNKRNIWAYLPPAYLENSTTRMPVVYMHDGQNLFDRFTSFS